MLAIERNRIYQDDCIELLPKFKSDSVDLVITDPPYNLNKAYTSYRDDLHEDDYVKWCNRWLYQLYRILKPTGSIFVVNLPKWCMYYAIFLDQLMYRQRWIVWDALSVPRGKIMPAHYGLLYYTKSLDYTFNRILTKAKDTFCLRNSCIRKRENDLAVQPNEISDLWFDLHRIRHRRDRDPHPCQLPMAMIERIIAMASKKGDLVFDPFMGVGTVAVVAKLMARDYVGIEIDSKYREICLRKLKNVKDYRIHLRNLEPSSQRDEGLVRYLDR
ncbi:MAG: DNA-methyltransferase [Candidatus Thorarchaeota archaeon]